LASALREALARERPPERLPTEPNASAYIPWALSPKQEAFDALDCREALYGGAAGGGKSVALLATGLRYVHIPGYSAILFRRHYPDLFQEGALIPLSHEWLGHTKASWNGEHRRWTFPSGARLAFGTMKHRNDTDKYQGAAFHFVGFDELTQHDELHYRYLFSRVRRRNTSAIAGVPLRTRATANPGGRGHAWVKQRFFEEGDKAGRVFIPARLEDNPHIDADEYRESLSELDPITRKRLEDGDWDVEPAGEFFEREWFRLIERSEVPDGCAWVRYWDLAATAVEPGKKPDYTVGALVGMKDGSYYIADIRRDRLDPADVEGLVAQTASEDGTRVKIRMEQEPGASGKTVIAHYATRVLVGYDFEGVRVSGDKQLRAGPVASAAKNGNVYMVRATWTTDCLDEHTAFPHGSNDDQVDGVSGAVAHLRPTGSGRVLTSTNRTFGGAPQGGSRPPRKRGPRWTR